MCEVKSVSKRFCIIKSDLMTWVTASILLASIWLLGRKLSGNRYCLYSFPLLLLYIHLIPVSSFPSLHSHPPHTHLLPHFAYRSSCRDNPILSFEPGFPKLDSTVSLKFLSDSFFWIKNLWVSKILIRNQVFSHKETPYQESNPFEKGPE